MGCRRPLVALAPKLPLQSAVREGLPDPSALSGQDHPPHYEPGNHGSEKIDPCGLLQATECTHRTIGGGARIAAIAAVGEMHRKTPVFTEYLLCAPQAGLLQHPQHGTFPVLCMRPV